MLYNNFAIHGNRCHCHYRSTMSYGCTYHISCCKWTLSSPTVIYNNRSLPYLPLVPLIDKLAERRFRLSIKVGIQPDSIENRDAIMDIHVKVALIESWVIILHVNSKIGFKVFPVARDEYRGVVVGAAALLNLIFF